MARKETLKGNKRTFQGRLLSGRGVCLKLLIFIIQNSSVLEQDNFLLSGSERKKRRSITVQLILNDREMNYNRTNQ